MRNKIPNLRLVFCRMLLFSSLLFMVTATHAREEQVQQLLEKEITLNARNESLKNILNKIQEQSDARFVYSAEVIEATRKVTLKVNKKQLKQVLNELFAPMNVVFELQNNQYIILSKKGRDAAAQLAQVQSSQVSFNNADPDSSIIRGVITDTSGNPMEGVTVSVKSSGKATVSGRDGRFAITVGRARTILVFTYVNYIIEEREVSGGASLVNVTMRRSTTSLDEVVVVGYGTQKKATVTGAISTVSSQEILKSPVSNVTNSLVGRLTGLSAVQRSGQPGNNEALINIRGSATYNNNAAIVVVDGVERSGFGDIDPNEIESITVLKDAASTAVFGIRGANGVIVITTKAGREGKPRISYSSNFSLQSYTGIPRALNAFDNATLINEANRNDNIPETWTADELRKFKDGSDPLGYPDINWFEYVTRKYYPQTQHNINVSGGTKVVKYFASVGYLFEDGIFKEFESPYGFRTTPSYHRYNFRSNVDFTLSKDLTVGVRLGGKMGQRYQPAGLAGATFSFDNAEAMISRIVQTPAFAYPVMLPDGRIAQNPNVGTNILNPYAVLTRWGTRNDDNNTLESTFNLSYKLDRITRGLSFKTVFGYDSYFSSTTRRNASWAAYVIDRQTKEISLASDRPRDEPLSGLNTSYGGMISSNLQTGFNYDRNFGAHSFTGLVLYTRQLIDQPGSGLNAPPRASQGVVSRVTYNYKRRYFAEVNAAYNGSEQFAPGKQYGFFPAVSAGWTLSNEKFMDNITWISNLKLRGSYGLVGNDKLNNRFLFLDNYSVATGGVTNNPAWSRPGNAVQFGLPTSLVSYPVVIPTSFGNPEVTWEKGVKRNIGLEASFFKNVLSLTVDLFDEIRSDILTNRSSGLLTYGQTYPALNIGEVYNKGYEVELNFQQKSGAFNYGLVTQLSFARNRIISRDEPPGRPAYMKQEGKPVGQFFGYMTEGFYQSEQDIANSPVNTLGRVIPGDLKYKDYNGDGKIDADDIVPIGYSRTPEYIYSFSPSVGYKGLTLSVLFQGVANVSSDVILSEQNNGQQMYEFQKGRWTPETAGTATWPALHSRGNAFINYRLNDFILQDASYLKIRNIELSYNLPQSLLRKFKVPGLRIYVSGQNLVTWTKYRMYLDPENINLSNTDFSKQSIYPTPRIMNFGINLQL
ncbi:TonB-dependent receptor [Aridibaculum aurantiacum]|uniref:TonB-dependent receptor n=1 Tax=Aridibaculum aurantiacum TaxID=2810307 RepID=UPI001A96A3B4|nr:TonB-dependent receptor [Aridibaculum aurantiacum]